MQLIRLSSSVCDRASLLSSPDLEICRTSAPKDPTSSSSSLYRMVEGRLCALCSDVLERDLMSALRWPCPLTAKGLVGSSLLRRRKPRSFPVRPKLGGDSAAVSDGEGISLFLFQLNWTFPGLVRW